MWNSYGFHQYDDIYCYVLTDLLANFAEIGLSSFTILRLLAFHLHISLFALCFKITCQLMLSFAYISFCSL